MSELEGLDNNHGPWAVMWYSETVAGRGWLIRGGVGISRWKTWAAADAYAERHRGERRVAIVPWGDDLLIDGRLVSCPELVTVPRVIEAMALSHGPTFQFDESDAHGLPMSGQIWGCSCGWRRAEMVTREEFAAHAATYWRRPGLWWISWEQNAEPGHDLDYRPAEWPPPDDVLAFWETGTGWRATGDRYSCVVALVRVHDEHQAKRLIESAWATGVGEWRFCRKYGDPTQPPGDRLPPCKWSLELKRWPWEVTPALAAHIYYSCMRCGRYHCMACESPAPDGYSGAVKTAVKWCSREECIADEAIANGCGVEAMKRVKERTQRYWRRDARCMSGDSP